MYPATGSSRRIIRGRSECVAAVTSASALAFRLGSTGYVTSFASSIGCRLRLLLGEAIALLQSLHLKSVYAVEYAIKLLLQALVSADIQ